MLASEETESAVLGTWQGDWTNDRSGGNGTLTIDVKSAEGGIVAGSGTVTGGPGPLMGTTADAPLAQIATFGLAMLAVYLITRGGPKG